MKRILHVGCGLEPLPDFLEGVETRLDIDPVLEPDIVASITDMGDIGEYDVVYSCHTLEHLHPHEVKAALREFFRVLAPGGVTVNIVPDLEGVQPTNDVVYVAPCGPITGIDMIFGHQGNVKLSRYMEHHTGFIARTLDDALREAGFDPVTVKKDGNGYQLVGFGMKARGASQA